MPKNTSCATGCTCLGQHKLVVGELIDLTTVELVGCLLPDIAELTQFLLCVGDVEADERRPA